MQLLVITGNVGKDPEQRQAGSDTVTTFSVGVRQGWGDKSSTNWFRCNVWGKRGDTIREHVAKGMKVTVTGELTIGEYQGKPQFDVRVNDLDWVPAGDRKPAQSDQLRSGGNSRYSGADLDDDVAF